MTPQLYQAIKIMSLPLQDLRMSIAEELEQNPALEAVGDSSVVSLDDMGSRPQDESDDYFDDSSDLGYTQSRSDTGEDKKRQFMEGVLSRPESLHDHLLWQLRVHPIPPRIYEIGELLINNLDDNGFKSCTVCGYLQPEGEMYFARGRCTSAIRDSSARIAITIATRRKPGTRGSVCRRPPPSCSGSSA